MNFRQILMIVAWTLWGVGIIVHNYKTNTWDMKSKPLQLWIMSAIIVAILVDKIQ